MELHTQILLNLIRITSTCENQHLRDFGGETSKVQLCRTLGLRQLCPMQIVISASDEVQHSKEITYLIYLNLILSLPPDSNRDSSYEEGHRIFVFLGDWG
jgi:hypothetical protein